MPVAVKMRIALLAIAASALLASAALVAQAPQDPRQLPRVQAADVRFLGSFTLPATDGTGRSKAEGDMTWGGFAVGLGPDGTSLYFGCHDWGSRLARVTIPEIGGVASIVEPCTEVKNLEAINPGDTNGIKLGGSFVWNGRLVVSAFAYYDGGHTARATHFAGGDLSSLTGPVRVGKDLPAMVGGYMGVIPPEWRALLGGPALTGLCCTSIISRSSYGPSVSVFDPDHVGTRASIPSKLLLAYPDAHQTLGRWDDTGTLFNGTTKVGGLAFPVGTRSLLFVQRSGAGFCYGPATADKTLVGKPDGNGNAWCFDPTLEDKGVYGYPYTHQVLAYDAVDLVAVKQGKRAPWDVKPYATWPLTEMSRGGVATMRSAAYDPATRRWFIVETGSDATPEVHVYEIASASGR